MTVECGLCRVPMVWERTVALVTVPQWEGVTPYRIDRFRCRQCQESVDCEVDCESH